MIRERFKFYKKSKSFRVDYQTDIIVESEKKGKKSDRLGKQPERASRAVESSSNSKH